MLSTRQAAIMRHDYPALVLSTGPIAYWPLSEQSGTAAVCRVNSAQNGVYNSDVSGWPPATGIGDGNTAPTFTANDVVNIYSATLNGAFNGQLGSLLLWVKVASAGFWTDGTTPYLVMLRVNASNRLYLQKSGNNRLYWAYVAWGTIESVAREPTTETGWMALGLTWSKTADQVIAYYNGAQTGSTQTGLNTWSGSLSSTETVIGASNTTPSSGWNGYLAHCALWNRALTPAEMASLVR
jgi:hypothetical protein